MIQERLTQNGFALTKGQIDQLAQFIDLLSKWNKIINLTAHREPIDLIDKDILDSLYAIKVMTEVVNRVCYQSLSVGTKPPAATFKGSSGHGPKALTTPFPCPADPLEVPAAPDSANSKTLVTDPDTLASDIEGISEVLEQALPGVSGHPMNISQTWKPRSTVEGPCLADAMGSRTEARAGDKNSEMPSISGLVSCLDMGSGGGAFGIILAITHPEFSVGFLESDRKKINFTKQAFRELKLSNGIFIEKRAEGYPKEYQNQFLLCVTRATWTWNEFLKHAHYYVQNYGHVFWMTTPQKGRHWQPTDLLGYAAHQVYDYTILPKNYKRALFISKKIS